MEGLNYSSFSNAFIWILITTLLIIKSHKSGEIGGHIKVLFIAIVNPLVFKS